MPRALQVVAVVLFALVSTCSRAASVGLPEPGLVLYGEVRNVDGRVNARLTSGTLTCEVTPPTGAPILLSTNLQNILDQFSYILLVPFETDIGSGVSSNTLRLSVSPQVYTLQFWINGVPTRTNGQPFFTFSGTTRGAQTQMDHKTLIAFPDGDGDGVPDWWEEEFFEGMADPESDDDGDGVSNGDEYVAGTDPTDPQSVFQFVRVLMEQEGGITVQWASIAERFYTLERSSTLTGDFSVVQAGITATPPRNTFLDVTATGGGGRFFYRVRVE